MLAMIAGDVFEQFGGAATVGPAGYSTNFSAQPPATDWATLSIPALSGATQGNDVYDMDTDVNTNVAANITTQTTSSTGNPPTAAANAVWSSTGLYLQTRPTGNRFTILLGKFVNNTGTNATQISISYLLTFSGTTAEESGKGNRVYYSVTGLAGSWVNISALNSTASSGSLSQSASVSLTWTNGGNLYVLFADDNSSNGSDTANEIDDFSLSVTAGSPVNSSLSVVISNPTNGATFPFGVSISATAAVANASSPTVLFFTNSGAGNTVFASAGSSASAPYNVNLGSPAIGTYNIYAVVTDGPSSATSTTNTFTVADQSSFVLTASLTSPTNGQSSTIGQPFPLTANVSVTTPVTITGVEFFYDGVSQGVDTSAPYSNSVVSPTAGTHLVYAAAADSLGRIKYTSTNLVTFVISGAIVGLGGYFNDFSALPAATDWATLSRPGSAGGADTYDIDTAVNTNNASEVVLQTTSSTANPPTSATNATWSSTGFYLQTRPTQNGYTLLMGKFVNNTGTNATQVTVSYLLTFGGTSVAEEGDKGTHVYYSLTGVAGSWNNIAELNNTNSSGTFNQSVNLSLNWTNGGVLYVLWADDNSSGGSDTGDQIDNFTLGVTGGTPVQADLTVAVGMPANNSVSLAGSSITATSKVLNGSSPYTVEYFTNSGAGNTVFASAGSATTVPFSVGLGTLPVGTYNIYAVVTNSNLVVTNSTTNTFYVANLISLTLTDPTNNATFEYTNAVSGTATVSGGRSAYSVQFYLDNVANGSPVTSSPYVRNFGTLSVGDHTIQAAVTDASGWVSNSLTSTIHIHGPLTVALTPTNGQAYPFGSSITTTGVAGGGTSPYQMQFFTNGQSLGALSASTTASLGMLPVGSYTGYVYATDSTLPTAEQAYSSTNIFTVTNNPLAVSLTSPTSGQSATAGTAFPLTATPSVVSPVTISGLQFFTNGVSAGTINSAPYSNSIANPAVGSVAVYALATDSLGRTAYSTTNTVTFSAVLATIVYNPYLQAGSTTGGVVRWRTSPANTGVVRYGTDMNQLTNSATEGSSTTNHAVQITGLQPNTKYFYSIDSTSISGSDYWFKTHPTIGAKTSARIWVLGDAGTAGNGSAVNQTAVRNAFYNIATNGKPADVCLMLGDNAYNTGTDAEYKTAVFDMYSTTLRNIFLWPVIGNHESSQSTSTSADYPYLHMFSTPQSGESGGMASSNPKYYSFDYANIHFVGLDSMTSGYSSNSAMIGTWLKNDLASTLQDWIVVFFHHPPYTHGSHNSDSESDLTQIRQEWVPIFEQYGVDLVLNGHSHVYERTMLINGHYGTATTFDTNTMAIDSGNGRTNGTGAYTKNAQNQGIVYNVVGCSGQASSTTSHKAMSVSLGSTLGSLVIDVSSNHLDVMFVTSTGATNDVYNLVKPESTPTTPSAPIGLVSTYTNSSSIGLKWTDTANNETGFSLERSLNGVSFTPVLGTGIDITNATNSGLISGTTYYYRVAATNASGASGYSNTNSVTTHPTAPVLVGVPADATVACNAVPTPPTVTATHDCDPSVTVTLTVTSNQAPNAALCGYYNYKITNLWTATVSGGCGGLSAQAMQVITVQDTNAPNITFCPGPVTVSCAAAVPVTNTALVTATDNCSPVTVTWEGDVISSQTCANRYIITRTYKAADACGNFSLCVQTITVNDITPPVLTAGSIASCYTTVAAAEAAAIAATGASDNCGGTVTKSASTSGSCTSLVTVTGMDLCGNTASITYTTRVDNVVPVISSTAALEGANVVKNCANPVTAGTVNIAVQASDNCSLSGGHPSVALANGTNAASASFVSESPAGTFNYTWTVSGSTASGTWTATVSASDLCQTATDTFSLCVTQSQVSGLVQLQDFVGGNRVVTFVATGGASTKTWTPTLNFSGSIANYLLLDVPAGTTGVSAKTDWNLRVKLAVSQDVNGNYSANFTNTHRLRAGDVDASHDNIVNFPDYSFLATQFYSYNTAADMTGDGVVDYDDYYLLGVNWFNGGDPE